MNKPEQVKATLNSYIDNNYNKIRAIYENPYQWPLLDPLRIEICHCVLIDSSQAAMTLCNHLLEKCLKVLLIHNEPVGHNFTDGAVIEAYYNQANKKWANSDLAQTIAACKGKGLITKPEAQVLDDYRDKYRNAFGHANPVATFKATPKKSVLIYNPVAGTSQKHEAIIAQFPFLQAAAQKDISDREVMDYFTYVDNIIRQAMRKIFQQPPSQI